MASSPRLLRSSGRRPTAVVVGAGPAGCLAAAAIARRGWRSILVERAEVGRDKCCGRCLNPRVAPLLERHGWRGEIEAAATGRLRTARIEVQSNRRLGGVGVDLASVSPWPGGGWLVPRDRLDARLWSRAVAEGVEGRRPAAATLESAGDAEGAAAVVTIRDARGEERIEAEIVVAADGLGSGIARAAGLAARGSGRKFGFSAQPLHAGASLPVAAEGVTMLVSAGGYLGLARDARGRVHAAGLVDAAGPLPRRPEAMAAAMLATWGVERTELAGLVAAGPMPWRPLGAVRGRVALVGDAAGYVEPFTGEGMAWAFESADLLAGVLGRFGDWSSRAAAAFADAHRRGVASRQRDCRRIAGIVERPRLLGVACRAASIAVFVPRAIAKRLVRS